MIKRTSMELVEGIRTLLLTKCDNVYFREGSENKTYPRIIFDVRPFMERRVVLEMDLWDMRGNEKNLQDLADDIEELIDGTVLSNPSYIASFGSNNDMKYVPDENKDFKHINMSFDIIYQS